MSVIKRLGELETDAKNQMRKWFLENYLPTDKISGNSKSAHRIISDRFASIYTASEIQDVVSEMYQTATWWNTKGIPEIQGSQYVQIIGDVKNSFLAIDFETANHDRNSACAVGLVKVENNTITQNKFYLIKPPTSYFTFTYLHKISWYNVQYAPTFKELWPQISSLFTGVDFCVAHNSPFDRSVFNACCNYYGIPIPNIEFKCTVKLARELWGIKPTKLPDVCSYFNIPLDHHNAASDAVACAKIMLYALNDKHGNRDFNRMPGPSLISNVDGVRNQSTSKTKKIDKDKIKIAVSQYEDLLNKNKNTSNIKISSKNENSTVQDRNQNVVSNTSDESCFGIILKIIGILILLYIVAKACGPLKSPYHRSSLIKNHSIMEYESKNFSSNYFFVC